MYLLSDLIAFANPKLTDNCHWHFKADRRHALQLPSTAIANPHKYDRPKAQRVSVPCYLPCPTQPSVLCPVPFPTMPRFHQPATNTIIKTARP